MLVGFAVAASFVFLFTEARVYSELNKRVVHEGIKSLNTDELGFYMAKRKSHWSVYESAYYSSQRGVFDKSEWSKMFSSMCREFLLESDIWEGISYGEGLAHSLSPEFRLYVEYSCQ